MSGAIELSGAHLRYNTSGTLLRRYIHGPGVDEPIVWYEGTGTSDRRWLVGDRDGSIIAVTNASGVATNVNIYDEYGIPGSSNAGLFQYTGQAWVPELGLYNYKARAYSSTLGRFMQPDPILYEGGMNLYAYVGNDPINSIDPVGLADVQVTREEIVWGWRRPCVRNSCSITGRDNIEAFMDQIQPSGFTQIQAQDSAGSDPYRDQPNLQNCPKSEGPYDPSKIPQNLPPGYSVYDAGQNRTNIYMQDATGVLHFTPDRYYQAMAQYNNLLASNNQVGLAAAGLGLWGSPYLGGASGLVAGIFFGGISGFTGVVGTYSGVPPVPRGCG